MVGMTGLGAWSVVLAVAVLRPRIRSPNLIVALFLAAAAATFALTDWRIGVALFGISGLIWVAAVSISRVPRLFGPTVLVLVGLFLGSFWYPLYDPMVESLPLLGLPYLLLRGYALLDDARQGIAVPRWPVTMVHLVPVHQVIAGPIEPLALTESHLREPGPPLDFERFVRGLDRVTNGFVKKLVLSELLFQTFRFQFQSSGMELVLELVAQALWFYLDFSGYMDIVIGAGTWMGWEPPENFDWPYSSRNIVQFWTRWHITLGDFIRNRLFNPMNITLQRGWFRGRPLVAGIVCYFVCMTWCGLWHRPNFQFMVWGALHGTAIAVFKAFEMLLLRRIGRQGVARWNANWGVRALSTAMTFAFVTTTFLFVVRPPLEAVSILSRVVMP